MENLEIRELLPGVYYIHQIKGKDYFVKSDGLVIQPSELEINSNNQANSSEIREKLSPLLIDVNVEPPYIDYIYETFGLSLNPNPPIYLNTHAHLDHMVNLYHWEELGAEIYAPSNQAKRIQSQEKFLTDFGFTQFVPLEVGLEFVSRMGYKPVKNIKTFVPGQSLTFGGLEIISIPFNGHSIGHSAFYIPQLQLFFISCLGYDIYSKDEKSMRRGFGPWYGFTECSIAQYYADIQFAENIAMSGTQILASSHAYPILSENPEDFRFPFKYMRDKIAERHTRVIKLAEEVKGEGWNRKPMSLKKLTEEIQECGDIIFPKSKFQSPHRDIYTFWEFWSIYNHLLYELGLKTNLNPSNNYERK